MLVLQNECLCKAPLRRGFTLDYIGLLYEYCPEGWLTDALTIDIHFGASLRWPSVGVIFMKIQENIPLAPMTTFRIGGKARYFVEVYSIEELKEAVLYAENNNLPIFVLGGGSNVLIHDDGFSGLVIRILIKNIEFKEVGDLVFVTAGAGLLWDEFVGKMVEKGLWGLENLSYIPGTIGAVPVQNIGAYGVEVKDFIESVEVFYTKSKEVKKLTGKQCGFDYRNSFFKTLEGKNFIIIGVTFKLSKIPNPNILYKDLSEYFLGKLNPTLSQIREAVIDIRKNKLPDWKKIGTAGSFFKNPIVKREHFLFLKKQFSDMPSFDVGEDSVKIPLAWILDKVCGLKGHKDGNVGLYEKQPLALVNLGQASGEEIKKLAQKIFNIVKEKTMIEIEWEVEYVA